MIVTIRINGAERVLGGIVAVGEVIRRGTASIVGRRLSAEGIRLLRELTPVNRYTHSRDGSTKRGFPPLRQQWKSIEEISLQSMYRAVLHNAAADDPAGLVVLRAVEAGAKRHTINSRGLYPLSWKEPRSRRAFIGRESGFTRGRTDDGSNIIADVFLKTSAAGDKVYADSVSHPGMQPFRMVLETRRILREIAGQSLQEFGTQIARAFGTGFSLEVR